MSEKRIIKGLIEVLFKKERALAESTGVALEQFRILGEEYYRYALEQLWVGKNYSELI